MIVLLGAWIVVLGILVYLFVAVSSGPATSSAPERPGPATTSGTAAERSEIPDAAPAGAPRVDLGGARAVPPFRSGLPRMDEPVTPEVPPAATTGDPLDLDLNSAMEETNRFYDRADYESALQAALKVLERTPGNVRMLRVIVSSSCIMGDPDKASMYWRQLPEADRAQMSARCARYNVTFTE